MNEIETAEKAVREEMARELISKIKALAETSSLEYTLGKMNAENTDNEMEQIKENYRADMNEGKLFAYDEILSLLGEYIE